MSLARYNDSLTLEQLIVAHNKIKANAASLYNEAQLLFENEMYARSYFLLCIASEKLGKSIIVISAIVDLMAEEINWRSFWKKLRNHKDKTGTIEFFENAVVSSDDNFTPWRTVAEQISDFEEIKMASLYADIFQVDFFTPNEIISAEMTKAILELVKHRLEFINSISPSDDTIRAVKKEDILDFELNTYCVEEPAYVGIKETLLSSPRLDNQTSVAALLAAIVEGTRTDGINLIALFDNEEIGNTSKQGAASILLHDMVKRIYRSLGCSEEETDCAMYAGMLLSVDVAHALHPNHKEKMDITNHPVLGDGFCIKEACSQSYATDAKAIGILRQLVDRNKIASQRFGHRSDVRGGCTLGSVASTLFPVRTVDIGIPLLSMHSARELMGRTDFDALASAVTAYFS